MRECSPYNVLYDFLKQIHTVQLYSECCRIYLDYHGSKYLVTIYINISDTDS